MATTNLVVCFAEKNVEETAVTINVAKVDYLALSNHGFLQFPKELDKSSNGSILDGPTINKEYATALCEKWLIQAWPSGWSYNSKVSRLRASVFEVRIFSLGNFER